MKLSERMILGATLIKHVSHIGGGDEGCALQCAGVAGGGDSDMKWVSQTFGHCPECSFGSNLPSTVGGVIVHLNDDHKWSIDRIAQYVASVEPAEAETAREEQLCTSNLTPSSVPLVADIVTWGT